MSNAADNAIEVQGLECRQGERTILHDVSFTVARGELFFVIGGSGCGSNGVAQSNRPRWRGSFRCQRGDGVGQTGQSSAVG